MDATPNPPNNIPYQPQPQFFQQPQVIYVQAPPRIVPYNKGWQVTKIVFLSIAIVFSVVLLGIGGGAVASYDSSFTDAFIEVIICAGPAAGVSIIWSTAELITICARGGKKGIHPGASVALHLLLWLGFAAAVILLSIFTVVDECDDDDFDCDSDSEDIYDTGVSFRSAGLAFSAMLMIIHFTLFVGACVETHKRNHAVPQFMIPPTGSYYQPATVQQTPVQSLPQAYPVPPQQVHLPMGGYPPVSEAQPPQQEVMMMRAVPPQEPKAEMSGVGTYSHSVSTPSVSAEPSTASPQQQPITHTYG